MVYVTHDQVEAMTLADRIAVLDQGVLQQLDTPEEIYGNPSNQFVAGFMGTPPMCFLHHLERDVVVGVRPHEVRVGDGPLQGTVKLVEPMGSEAFVHLAVGEDTLVARVTSPPNVGDTVAVGLDHTYRFEPGDGGSAILVVRQQSRASLLKGRPVESEAVGLVAVDDRSPDLTALAVLVGQADHVERLRVPVLPGDGDVSLDVALVESPSVRTVMLFDLSWPFVPKVPAWRLLYCNLPSIFAVISPPASNIVVWSTELGDHSPVIAATISQPAA